jgi:hypothetical protein
VQNPTSARKLKVPNTFFVQGGQRGQAKTAFLNTSNALIESGVNEFIRRSRTSRVSEVIIHVELFTPLTKGTAIRHRSDTKDVEHAELAVPCSGNRQGISPAW